jgi:hypothetical protein
MVTASASPAISAGDCDDAAPGVHPGLVDPPGGGDEDCSGVDGPAFFDDFESGGVGAQWAAMEGGLAYSTYASVSGQTSLRLAAESSLATTRPIDTSGCSEVEWGLPRQAGRGRLLARSDRRADHRVLGRQHLARRRLVGGQRRLRRGVRPAVGAHRGPGRPVAVAPAQAGTRPHEPLRPVAARRLPGGRPVGGFARPPTRTVTSRRTRSTARPWIRCTGPTASGAPTRTATASGSGVTRGRTAPTPPRPTTLERPTPTATVWTRTAAAPTVRSCSPTSPKRGWRPRGA